MFQTRWSMMQNLDDLRRRIRRGTSVRVQHQVELKQRVAELEDELGRVSLLAFALAGLCLDKGLVTIGELGERMKSLDASDGAPDGKLAPGRPFPETPPAPPIG
jgi:hypothetical protein